MPDSVTTGRSYRGRPFIGCGRDRLRATGVSQVGPPAADALAGVLGPSSGWWRHGPGCHRWWLGRCWLAMAACAESAPSAWPLRPSSPCGADARAPCRHALVGAHGPCWSASAQAVGCAPSTTWGLWCPRRVSTLAGAGQAIQHLAAVSASTCRQPCALVGERIRMIGRPWRRGFGLWFLWLGGRHASRGP